MATGSDRDVTLGIGVTTSGTEALANLRKSVLDLAAAGGEAAPEFDRLAVELDKVAGQQAALSAFTALRASVRSLASDMEAAAAQVDSFAQPLAETRASAEIFSQAQKEAGETVRVTSVALKEARDAYRDLREETPRAAKATDDYKIQSGELRATITTLTQELRTQRTAYRETSDEAKAAALAEREVVASYNQAVSAARSLSSELGSQSAALAASRTALEGVGVATSSLVESQQAIRAAFDQTRIAIADQIATQTALANAQRVLDAELRLEPAFIEAATAAQREASAVERQRVETVLALSSAIQTQSRAASASLEAAFSATGVRSAAAIDAELRKIDDALTLIARDAKASGADFDRAFAASRTRVEALKNELQGLPATIRTSTTETNLLGDAVRQASVYFSLFTVGKEFIEANTQLEGLRRALTIVTGSSAEAAKQIAYLRKTSDDTGVAFNSLAGAYGKFSASALASGIDLQTVQRTFTAVTKSAANLGLSSEEVGGALVALGQIASKGKVQMEELGQQLGDRLPAVLATTAKGLGVTTAQLTKLIETGQVLGDATFFNAFSKGLEDSFIKGSEKTETLNASIGRLKNSINELFTKFGEAGVVKGLSIILSGLTTALTEVSGVVLETTQNASGFVAALVQLLNTDISNIPLLSLRFKELGEASSQSSKSMDDFIESLGPLGQTILGGLPGFDALIIRHDRLKASQNAAAVATSEFGKSLEANILSGLRSLEAEDALHASIVKIQADYATILDPIQKNIHASEQLAHARQFEAQTIVDLAKLSGNEIELRNASVAAAITNAKGLADVAAAREVEAAVLKAEIDAIRAAASAQGTLNETRAKQLVDLQNGLAIKEADAEKAREAALLAQRQTDQQFLLRDAYKETGAALAEISANVDFYSNKLAFLREQQALGVNVNKEVADTERQLALARGQQANALDDITKALERKASRQKLDADLTIASLNASKSYYDSLAQVFDLQGNEAAATEARIQGKQIEIQVIQAKIVAQKLEAQASIAAAEAERTELETTGKLTEAKKLEIEARIAHAKAIAIEADASGNQVKVIQQQIDNIRTYGTESVKSRGGSSSAIDGETASYGSNTAAISANSDELTRNIATIRARNEAIRQGSLSSSVDAKNNTELSTSDGKKAGPAVDNTGVFAILDKIKAGKIDISDLDLLRAVNKVVQANLQLTQQAAPGTVSEQGRKDIQDQANLVRLALEKLEAQSRTTANNDKTQKEQAAIQQATSGQSDGTLHQVTITINGKRSVVNAATEADANTLVATLTALGDAANRS